MTRTLWDALGEVPDTRGAQGLQYPLQSALGMATAAMLAGANDLKAIYRWCKRLKPEALLLFGVEDGKAPCHSAWFYIFRSIDGDALSRTLGRFALDGREPGHVAIDGKTL